MRLLARLIAGAVLLVVVVLGGVYVASQQRPGVARDLDPVRSSATAARSFDDKVEALSNAVAEAKRTGRAQAVEVAFTEEELTTMAAQTAARQTAGEGLSAENTQIHLAAPNIIATSTLTLGSLTVNVAVVAEPVVENGRTKLVVKEIQTGLIPLPDAIRHQINAQVGSEIEPSRFGLAIDVSQVQVVDGRLVIRGIAHP